MLHVVGQNVRARYICFWIRLDMSNKLRGNLQKALEFSESSFATFLLVAS
jgi:hypothetical protein